MENTGESTFRVDLRLLLELGERLISRDEVAVIELVKNAYDADASEVEVVVDLNQIIVTDDGLGMNIDQINEGWFTIGTSIKKGNLRTKKGRRVLGEKGLGRLALFRLGSYIKIFTKRKNQSCYEIIMNWEESKKLLESGKYTPLSDMKLSLSKTKRSLFKKGYGTIIVISKLNSEWKQKNVNRLKIFLSRLIDPTLETVDKFGIKLYYQEEEIEIEPPEFIKKPHYYLDVKVNGKGEYSGEMKWDMKNGLGSKKIPETKLSKVILPSGDEYSWKSVKADGCGPFKFQLNMWDLDSPDIEGNRTTLRDWSGVSLFRDGFRVVQPDVDWLGLDLRRVQTPALRFSTNQVIGSIFITAEKNPNLIDKTDREGILEIDAFYIMEGAIYHFMNHIERERFKLRRKKRLTHEQVVKKIDPEPIKDIIKKIQDDDIRKILEEFIDNMSAFKELMSEWMLGRDRLATMGILVSKLIHSARTELAKITDTYSLIEREVSYFDPQLKNRILRMVDGGKKLSDLFKQYDPLLRFRTRKRERINLNQYIETIKFTFEPTLINSNIGISNKVPKNLFLRINPTDIYVLISNLIDNSIYWINDAKDTVRTIEIRARKRRKILHIEVADSGQGVDEEYLDQIFQPGFTLKPNGTGMGLAIVSDILEIYNGIIEVDRDEVLRGALFTLKIPEEGKKR